MVTGWTESEVAARRDDDDLDKDAMIADYLESQIGDLLECEPGGARWPRGRGSKLLDQTL